MSKKILRLNNALARQAACRCVIDAPDGYVCTISEPTRNLEQNALMWVLLHELEIQTDWHGIKLSAEEWKDLLSAGLVKSKVVPNIDGTGFVILGQRTSRMSKREMGDLLELIYAFGTERGVVFEEQQPAKPVQISQGIEIRGECERVAA